MSSRRRRIVLSLGFVAASLLLELVACAGVAGATAVYMGERKYWLNRVMATTSVIWTFSVMYRALFLHLYASWRLKRFLIARRLAAPLVALADLVLALVYAGVLSLFFPPARALFENVDWGVPIFSAIFLGSLLFSLFCRRSVVSVFEKHEPA
jgi:hypothetical protein